jgi:hypothetical protein
MFYKCMIPYHFISPILIVLQIIYNKIECFLLFFIQFYNIIFLITNVCVYFIIIYY